MAKWLDKYEQGGMVLKKKTKDNYGKKPNVNDVKVSAGPGFEGDGYTAQNWKSPAWGGQFEMGGSMPGAVGFMYARTQNPAPANGKYTKKTLASAQEGKKVSKPNPNEKAYQAPDRKKIEDWFSNYYASPFFKENLYDKGNAFLPNEGEAVGNVNRENIKNLKYTFDDFMSNGYPKGTGLQNDREINMGNPNGYLNQSRNVALAHEMGHINQNDILAHQPRNVAFMLNRNKVMDRKKEANTVYEKASELTPMYDGKPKYPGLPSAGLWRLNNLQNWAINESHKSIHGWHDDLVPELRADIMALRYQAANEGIWDAAKSKPGSFNSDMLNKLYQSKELNTPEQANGWLTEPQPRSIKPNDLKNVAPPKQPGMILNRLRARYNDSELLYLMNKLAKNEGDVPMDQAQNGKEMKFWQDGLDFKPKSISKKGKKIIKDDMGQWAHPGEITEIGSPNITMQGVDYPVLGISDTGDTQMMYPNQDYKFDGKKVTEYPMAQNGELLKKFSTIINDQVPSTSSVQRKIADDIAAKQYIALQKQIDKQGSITKAGPRQSALSKTWSVLTNPMTALEYKVHGKDLPDHFEMGPRNVLDYAVDFINPYGVADAASNVPGDLARGDLGSAALNTLAALPALHETGAIAKATKTARQLGKAKNLKEAAGYLAKGIPVEKSLPRLAEGEVKTFRKLQEIPKMQEAGKSRADQMRFAIENDIPDTHFERIFQMPKKDAQNLINSGFGERPAVDREALRNRFRELDQQVNIPQNPSINTREAWISDIDDLTAQGAEPNHDFYEQLGHRTTPTSYEQMTDSEIESLRNHLFDRQMSARRQRIADENTMLGVDYDVDRDLYDLSDLDLDTNDFINHYESQQTRQNNKGVQNIGDKLTRAEISARDKVNTFIQNATQSYPYYSGGVEEKVPSLFRSQERSLNDISRKVAKQTENIPSGTVYTGSLNTSHNSWLPQTKQIFNYEGGTPQFTGYKPMNSLGYLSRAQVPEEDIIKYLNTEMDELVKRGKLPKNVQRPMMFKGHPMLPQYAIKQKKSGGWLNKYK